MTDSISTEILPRSSNQPTDAALTVARQLMADGDQATAIQTLSELAENTSDPEISFTLGVWCLNGGRAIEALRHFQNSASLAPGVPEVFINLATAAGRLRRHVDALDAATRAVALASRSDIAQGAMGNALLALGRPVEAEAAYLEAHKLVPSSVTWMLNLGHCLMTLDNNLGARSWFERALKTQPDSNVALNGLALCDQAAGNHSGAIKTFDRAIAHDEGYAEAWGNIAVSLQCVGRHHDALAAAQRSIELEPGSPSALLNLGHILQALGRHDEATQAYDDALKIEPNLPGVRAYLLHSRRHVCQWDGDADLVDAVVKDVAQGAQVPPFALAGTNATPQTRLVAAKRSAAAHKTAVLTGGKSNISSRGKKPLRIGFVSPDFRTHSLAMSFSSVLRARDDPDFEWIGYSIAGGAADALTSEFHLSFDRMVDLGPRSTEEAVSQIRSDGIDVLVDLAGHTRGSRLDIFAHRPAAVQVHYLGYGSTVGADYIPWLITDRVHTPPTLAPHCSEALVYLPNTFMAAAGLDLPRETPDRIAESLPADGIVFACFNATYKLEPESFASWMRILAKIPGSVLWLRGTSDSVMARLRHTAEVQGVAADRLIFAERKDRASHLTRHRLADICLDSFNHAGGVTTIDALLAGVPVITIAGSSQSARTGASILSALGMPTLVQEGIDGYEKLAAGLATDPLWLEETKDSVRQQVAVSPLFDPAALARDLNAAFRAVYDITASGDKPATFDVASAPG
ncbi:MAG: tetratricopeptide repeat protein [Alphaproteobacteria bacterium]|nr:tetratricopeptide repeat protein [Alphaproteobacteria bacterium]